MLNVLIRNRSECTKLVVLTFVAILSFQFNFFKFADQYFFDTFDEGSQALILGAITSDKLGLDKGGAHIGFMAIGRGFDYTKNMLDAYPIFAGKIANEDVYFSPYKSQYGIQGPFFSSAYSWLKLDTLSKLQFLNVALFALVVSVLSLLFSKVYNIRYAAIFFMVMVSSPWVIAFARNLYWMPVLWFLPAIFSTLCYRARNTLSKYAYAVLVGVAVFVKSLAGYEYLSAITLFACSVFIVAPLFDQSQKNVRSNIKFFVLAFAFCVLGFMCALLLHAGMRGDSIAAGLQNIYEQDVKRRTYGDPSTFDDVFKASLQSSPLDVLWSYIQRWNTSLALYVPGTALKWMMVFAVLGFIYSSITKRVLDAKHGLYLLLSFAASASWFVLAKGHSYIHTQLNYVLWYFGFVQALFYVCIVYLSLIVRDFFLSVRSQSFHKLGVMFALMVGLVLLVLFNINQARQNDFEKAISRVQENSSGFAKSSEWLSANISNRGEISFYSMDCSKIDLSKTFYLHVYRAGPTSQENAFENLDFQWQRMGVQAPSWPFKYSRSCLATVKLPDYRIQKLAFGQYEFVDGSIKVLWGDLLDLTSSFQNKHTVAFDLTDSNWVSGVTIHAFFIKNDFANRQLMSINDDLRFAGSGVHRVNRLEYTAQFINVIVDGSPLSPSLDGYPHLINILR
jgi:hypothetical protein